MYFRAFHIFLYQINPILSHFLLIFTFFQFSPMSLSFSPPQVAKKKIYFSTEKNSGAENFSLLLLPYFMFHYLNTSQKKNEFLNINLTIDSGRTLYHSNTKYGMIMKEESLNERKDKLLRIKMKNIEKN